MASGHVFTPTEIKENLSKLPDLDLFTVPTRWAHIKSQWRRYRRRSWTYTEPAVIWPGGGVGPWCMTKGWLPSDVEWNLQSDGSQRHDIVLVSITNYNPLDGLIDVHS